MEKYSPVRTRRPPETASHEHFHEAVQALLDQRAELAHLEKAAALKERTMRVAHDIRNPLATIQAVCSSLILETDDTHQRERLELISAQVERLAATLAVAVEGAGDADDAPVPVDLRDLASSLVNLLQYQTRGSIHFAIRIDPDLHCRAPERGLTRSLYHLLRNAAEAVLGRPAAQVIVDAHRTGGELEIAVRDNGPGLPPALLEQGLRIYSAAQSGSALGLCSVERFLRGLGGKLLFGERATGGAEVRMLLPVDCGESGLSAH
jgi:two-component system C4-dicarboxylate transport sensor histidine kinase DctB